METFSALPSLCAPWIPLTKSVTRSFDVFFDLRLNKRLKNAGDLRRHRAHYDVAVMSTEMSRDDYKV